MTKTISRHLQTLQRFGERHERTLMRITLFTLLLIVLLHNRVDRRWIDAITTLQALIWGSWVVVGLLAEPHRKSRQ